MDQLFVFDYCKVAPLQQCPTPVWNRMTRYLENRYGNIKSRVKLIDRVDSYFSDSRNPTLDGYWVGFMHSIPKRLTSNQRFIKSLPQCLTLFTFSNHHAQQLRKLLPDYKGVIRHINYFKRNSRGFEGGSMPPGGFDLAKFQANFNPFIVLTGRDGIRPDRFYKVETRYAKCWVTNAPNPVDWLRDAMVGYGVVYDDPLMVQDPTTERYNRFLEQNLVVLDYEGGASLDALLDCIVNATPVFVNALPPVVELLGREYPLYFSSIDELQSQLSKPELITEAHRYLTRLGDARFNVDRFEQQFSKLQEQVAGLNGWIDGKKPTDKSANHKIKSQILTNMAVHVAETTSETAITENLRKMQQVKYRQIPAVPRPSVKRRTKQAKPSDSGRNIKTALSLS